MALLVKITNGEKFQTHVGIPLLEVYTQISHLDYDKDAFSAQLKVRYFVDAAASQLKKPDEFGIMRASAGFKVEGLPDIVKVSDPLGLLASPNSNAYTIAYSLLKEALEGIVNSIGIVENV